jgi:hypothetical protein
MGREEMRRGVYLGHLMERDYTEDLRLDERIILKCIFNK